jgi:hypothetical protein
MREPIYEDILGPLPQPPTRAHFDGKSLFLQVFMCGGWLNVAKRNRRKREWAPLFSNVQIEEQGDSIAICVSKGGMDQ